MYRSQQHCSLCLDTGRHGQWAVGGMARGQWEGWLVSSSRDGRWTVGGMASGRLDMGPDTPCIPAPWVSKGTRQIPFTRDAGRFGAAEGRGTAPPVPSPFCCHLENGPPLPPGPCPWGCCSRAPRCLPNFLLQQSSKHQTAHLKISGPFLAPRLHLFLNPSLRVLQHGRM